MCRKELAQQAGGYLERTVCRVVPWLVFGSLDCSHHFLPKRGSLCLFIFMQAVCFMQSTCFTSASLEFWQRLVTCDQSLMKPLTRSLSRVCLVDDLIHDCHSLMLRELRPVRLHWEGTLGSVYLGSFDFSQVHSPLLILFCIHLLQQEWSQWRQQYAESQYLSTTEVGCGLGDPSSMRKMDYYFLAFSTSTQKV